MLRIDDHTVVDLTQPLGPGATVWPGALKLAVERESTWEHGNLYSRRIAFEEHCGTHLDAPGHVRAGALLVDAIPASALLAPARVLDLEDECAGETGFTVEPCHLEQHEARYGPVPTRSIVVVRTGWDRLLGQPGYLGDGPDFPGFGPAVASQLVARAVVGLGIDTAGVDPGAATNLPVHQLTAAAGVYHLEGLVRLDQLPPTGSLLFVGAPPLVRGSGVPARVLGLVPRA